MMEESSKDGLPEIYGEGYEYRMAIAAISRILGGSSYAHPTTVVDAVQGMMQKHAMNDIVEKPNPDQTTEKCSNPRTGFILFRLSKIEGEPPSIAHFTEWQLIHAIDRAKKKNMRILVFRLGECLLDWS